ncbi:ethanolamine ammonia-lyase reactivating factor EutA [Paracrocinitomix mangrovi]|uniref:Ppx/GppA phosphatase family protein n=1 Tax=Paracrocinitomix mangrovi TaxID=2862509 RepID=UPI001C8F0CEC|nr:ethanolamine ammonia-lyase reactivating factor EutA [Paracrocinitomix mangrovi]UKN01101.1 ethanolamine ammonia-lyase reactivating factor EutA [Paracrocinitomix mangrovi]
MSRFGAIDIGTNAARLLIGEVEEEGDQHFVKKISYTRIPLRLGLEVFDNGKISESKITEFVKSIQAFKLIAEVFNVDELRACATSAMREAENGKQIKKKIKKETGVEIEIIEGAEEAKLILSTFFLLEFNSKSPFIVIDVGGGSTEVSIFKKGEKVASQSFTVGTIRLLKEKVKSDIWEEVDKWIDQYIKKDVDYITFATGGNINKIHKLLGKKSAEPIGMKEFNDLADEISKMSLEKRVSEFKLKPDRADVIAPAFEIYRKIFKKLGSKEVFVPKIGLSDGMIYNLHKKHKRKKS